MRHLLTPLIVLCATWVSAAPADDVAAAAKKLASASNYAWTRNEDTINSQFNLGPVEGATDNKTGYTILTRSINGSDFVTVRKGPATVSKFQDGPWLTAEEHMAQFQGASKRSRITVPTPVPAEELAALVSEAKELKVADDVVTGILSDDAIARRIAFAGQMSAKPGAAGSIKIWLKDGDVTKYQFHVKGTVPGRQGDIVRDTTTTVEIKNVGKAKVAVPAEAKQKLGS